MPAKLYDWENKDWVMVPDEQVGQLVGQGSHSFAQDVDVPVIGQDGTLGSVKGQDAQEAFSKHGYRWANYDDAKAWEDRGREESMARITDTGPGVPGAFGTESPQAQAFYQSVGGAIMPGFNTVAKKLAGAFGADEQTVGEIQDNLAARNPYHSLAGSVVGGIIGPVGKLAGAAGNVAGKAAGGFTEGVAAGVTRSETAAKIASTIAERSAQSAVESAIFTGADQINEAIIGDPYEVAENLATNLTSSAIFGGIIGGGVGGAESAGPQLKRAFGWAAGKTAELANKLEQKVASGIIMPALTMAGKGEYKEAVRGAISDSEARAWEMFGGGRKKAAEVAAKGAEAEEQLQEQAKQMYAGVQAEVKGAPKLVKKEIDATLAETRGDIAAAMDDLHERVSKAEESLYTKIEDAATDPATAMEPGVLIGDVEAATKTLGRQATKRGDKVADAVARDTAQYYEAQKTAAQGSVSAHQEVKIGFELRKKAIAALDNAKLTADGREALEGYVRTLSKNLHEHPVYGELIQTMDHEAASLSALSEATQKTLGKANSLPKDFFVKKMMTDPAFRERMEGLMKVLPDAHGKLKGFFDAAGDLSLQQGFAKELEGLIAAAGGKGGFSHAELDAIAEKLGRPDLREKLTNVTQIQKLLDDGEIPTLAKWGRMMDVLGMERPSGWGEMSTHGDTIQTLTELRGPVDGNTLADLAKTVLKKKAGAIAGAAAGGILGHEFMDGLPGTAVGAGVGLAVGALAQPASVINTLTRLEALNNKAAKLAAAGVGRAIDGLVGTLGTGDKARHAFYAAAATTYRKPEAVTKETFEGHREYLDRLSKDVGYRHEQVTNRLGTIPGAPNISAAVIGQYSRGVDFLAGKIPTDPMAGLYLHPGEEKKWHPSDVELSKYNRYVQTVENPLVALDHIASGRGTPEEYETLQTVYPTLFGKLQQGVLNAIMKPDTHMSYQNRVQIGQFLGITPDPTLRPEFMATMQKPFIDQRAQASQGGGGSGGGAAHAASNPKVSFDPEANQTDVERVTFK